MVRKKADMVDKCTNWCKPDTDCTIWWWTSPKRKYKVKKMIQHLPESITKVNLWTLLLHLSFRFIPFSTLIWQKYIRMPSTCTILEYNYSLVNHKHTNNNSKIPTFYFPIAPFTRVTKWIKDTLLISTQQFDKVRLGFTIWESSLVYFIWPTKLMD